MHVLSNINMYVLYLKLKSNVMFPPIVVTSENFIFRLWICDNVLHGHVLSISKTSKKKN